MRIFVISGDICIVYSRQRVRIILSTGIELQEISKADLREKGWKFFH